MIKERSAVGEDEFTAFGGEEVDRGEACEVGSTLFVEGEQEDALGAGPGLAESFVGSEYGRGIGPEGAIPEAVDAPVDEVDLPASIEDQGGAGGEFALLDEQAIGATFLGKVVEQARAHHSAADHDDA